MPLDAARRGARRGVARSQREVHDAVRAPRHGLVGQARAPFGSPVSSITSRARTIRRPFCGVDARRRSRGRRSRSRAMQQAGARARRAPPRARARTAASVPGKRKSKMHARDVEARAADEERDAPAREDRRRSRARAARWYPATDASSVTSSTSSRWCGTPAPLVERELGGADVHAAVELHGVGVDDLGRRGRRARSARRGRARSADLPVPVAPTIAMQRRRQRCASRRVVDRHGADAGRTSGSAPERGASAVRARRGRRRMPRGRGGTPQDSACARSQASPARVRRMRSGAPSSESASRWNGAACVTSTETTSPGRGSSEPAGHLEVHEAAVFGAAAQAVGLGVLLALARRDEHLDRAADELLVLLPARSAPAAR